MKKFLFLILLTLSIKAQDKELNFEFDYARFNYDTTSTYLEMYYVIEPNELQVIQKDDQDFIEVDISVTIINKATDQLVVDKKYRVNNIVENTDSTLPSLVGVVGFLLNEGIYALNVTATDANNSELFKIVNDELSIGIYGEKEFSLSDIQLASKIVTENVNQNSVFYKNTMEIVPNPQNIFGKNLPVVFYYSELYNLENENTDVKTLTLDRKIFNSVGRIVYDKSKEVVRSKNSIVEAGALNVAKYPTGSYTLALSLIDPANKKAVSSTKKFFIYNPDIFEEQVADVRNLGVIGSEFGVMTEDECDLHYNRIKFIASNNEIAQYEKLSELESKREFLFNFWQRRDPNPNTPENEFKREFEDRIKFVENRFKTFNKTGSKTDRGRVYLQYGEPDEMELHPNDYDKKPYEIWYYNSIEGGVIFVFGDITGYSDYELLHSTKRGELRDDNWVRRILAN
jgi:GWxTD domain-containing protein